MECKFHVGQKVVLVKQDQNADAHRRFTESMGYNVEYPEMGAVYTVREVRIHEIGIPVIRLVEIVNPAIQYANAFGELWLDASKFRPVIDRKTDISIFKAMLTPKTVEVAA